MRAASLLAIVVATIATPALAIAATLQDQVAPCLACHGEKGQSENPGIPSLGAQQQGFVLVQLYMFREKLREVEVMNQMAKGMTDDDLRNISEFISKIGRAHV